MTIDLKTETAGCNTEGEKCTAFTADSNVQTELILSTRVQGWYRNSDVTKVSLKSLCELIYDVIKSNAWTEKSPPKSVAGQVFLDLSWVISAESACLLHAKHLTQFSNIEMITFE